MASTNLVLKSLLPILYFTPW